MRLVYWANTLEDLQQALRFKVSEKQIEAVQMYEAFSAVAFQALGGEVKETLAEAEVKPENRATTSAEAVKIFQGLFG